MLSPVWRAKLCGDIGSNEGKQLTIDEEDEKIFSRVVALGCGEAVKLGEGLEELTELVKMVDRYQVEVVQGDLEEAVLNRLNVENCGRILTISCGSGLLRLERASRELALREFDRFAECEGFMDVSEEVLGSLLDDDELISESEEQVLQAVVRWMKGGLGVRSEARTCCLRSGFHSCRRCSLRMRRGRCFRKAPDWRCLFWSRACSKAWPLISGWGGS